MHGLQGEAGNVKAEAELTVLVSPSIPRVSPWNVSVSRGLWKLPLTPFL